MERAKRAQLHRDRYKQWKTAAIENRVGFFPVFSPMLEDMLLSRLSGNAVRLYVYLGLRAKNETGECWVTIETISRYFKKSKRTVSNWIQELEREKLIARIQFDKEEPAHTFLLPYGAAE